MSSDFRILPDQTAHEMLPTGVHEWERVPLYTLFPQLGKLPLDVYWKLRIACCAHLIVTGPNGDELKNCDRCHLNRGYVCPRCLGATWLSTGRNDPPMVRCPDCTVPFLDEKNKPSARYDSEKELLSAQQWLARTFPYGVPHTLADRDLDKAKEYR